MVSMLQESASIFYRPKVGLGKLSIIDMLKAFSICLQEKKIEADQARQNFVRPTGDHFTLLNVFNEWADSGFSIAWTYEYVGAP